MKFKALASTFVLVGTALIAPGAFAIPASPDAPTKTIVNLRAAYAGETSARAKYAAYALSADNAGYREVAQLFRAVCRAEMAHAQNHRLALALLGVTDPKAGTYTGTPGTTKHNLTDALKGESYERDTMYPLMIQQAKAEGQADAERAMTFALSAERQHAVLYTAALKNLNKKPAPEGFYVCPVCGATYTTHNVPAVSPVCGTPKSQFNLVK